MHLLPNARKGLLRGFSCHCEGFLEVTCLLPTDIAMRHQLLCLSGVIKPPATLLVAIFNLCCTASSAACPTQDVLVLMQEPVVPMSFMRAKPIGVMGMIDQVGSIGCPAWALSCFQSLGVPAVQVAAQDAESCHIPVAALMPKLSLA